MYEDGNYTVYRHVFPNGKVYIGITGGNPKDRWANGMGYQANQKMFSDIVKYGWDNIEHQIVKDGLSHWDAAEMERTLITAFGKDGRNKTYNIVWAEPLEKSEPNFKDLNYSDVVSSRSRVQKIDDDWVGPYTESGMYLILKYTPDKIFLEHICEDSDGNSRVKIFTFIVPFDGSATVGDVLKWLYSKPTPDEETDCGTVSEFYGRVKGLVE